MNDLPPELLDHIVSFVPTAQGVAAFGAVSQTLHTFTEKDAWQTFGRSRFSSLYPANPPSHKDAVRSLTTLSKAWDRRAFLARYVEPHGDISKLPENTRVPRWKRPRGQTIGFTPQIDCFEETGPTWRERREILAFSAGAEICMRVKDVACDGIENVKWSLYRPHGALEGRDDITSLHLVRPQRDGGVEGENGHMLITGTANGSLRMFALSEKEAASVPATDFVTQGLPVRSTSLLQEQWKSPLLAVNTGDTRISIYCADPGTSQIEPLSSVDIRPAQGQRKFRAWSTTFLSSATLAIGVGMSPEPIHIYSLSPSGLEKEPLRKYNLPIDAGTKLYASSVYPITPLPPASNSAAGSGDGHVFLSGAYDGNIRLHDLRSNQQWEQIYSDPTDDSAIYSLLPRGREKLVAGTSSHSLLKVFDLRLGAKAYSYLDASNPSMQEDSEKLPTDWNLFLKPNSATYPGRGGGNNWARRSAESSIYSLASPSTHSPYIYAGVESAIVELAFTSVTDRHPDPAFFGSQSQSGQPANKHILDLAMYDQGGDMKLIGQRSVGETLALYRSFDKVNRGGYDKTACMSGLDERWKVKV